MFIITCSQRTSDSPDYFGFLLHHIRPICLIVEDYIHRDTFLAHSVYVLPFPTPKHAITVSQPDKALPANNNGVMAWCFSRVAFTYINVSIIDLSLIRDFITNSI